MKGKIPDQRQRNLFRPILKEIVNPKHGLVVLAHKIDWNEFERHLSPLYSNTEQPGIQIRTMVVLLLLKNIYNLGDKTVMDQLVQNPYFQYFCRESEFQRKPPCDPSDLVHFRNRIGKEGSQKIFQLSVETRKDEIKTHDVLIDTTAQGKNITHPTDAKLTVNEILVCNKIAEIEKVKQRQSYRLTVKRLMLQQRFAHHPKRRKQTVGLSFPMLSWIITTVKS